MSKVFAALIVFAVVACSYFTVNAQSTTGTLRITVVDAAGSVIAGASVKVKNEGTDIESTGVTNSDGTVTLGSLNPGGYTITIEANGFKRSVHTGNSVKSNTVNPVSISLEAGSVAETVTVTASTDDTLQTAQSQISKATRRSRYGVDLRRLRMRILPAMPSVASAMRRTKAGQ